MLLTRSCRSKTFVCQKERGTSGEIPLRYGDETLAIIEAVAEIIARSGAHRSSQRNGISQEVPLPFSADTA